MKAYKAIVTDKDTKKTLIVNCGEHINKADCIDNLRHNGYKVNPKKVKPADVFDYILDHTNMNPWDWDLKKVPSDFD